MRPRTLFDELTADDCWALLIPVSTIGIAVLVAFLVGIWSTSVLYVDPLFALIASVPGTAGIGFVVTSLVWLSIKTRRFDCERLLILTMGATLIVVAPTIFGGVTIYFHFESSPWAIWLPIGWFDAMFAGVALVYIGCAEWALSNVRQRTAPNGAALSGVGRQFQQSFRKS